MHLSWQKASVFTVALACVLVLAGGTVLADTPQYGGTFNWAMPRDVGSVDPASSHSTPRINVSNMIFNGLVQFDEDANVVPDLAHSWDVSDDGMTYTFYLEEDVYFHSGRKMTAADVKFSFERLSNPKTEALGYWLLDSIKGKIAYADGEADEIEGIRVIDDYTVEIQLETGDGGFLRKLGTAYASIVCSDGIGDEMELIEPIGTGPFQYVEYEPNEHVKLERFDNYWEEGLPYLDAVHIDMLVDDSVQMMRYQVGDQDLMDIVDPVILHTLQSLPQFADTIEQRRGASVQILTLNNQKEPFTDKRVRQAVLYAIDRERITQDVIGGLGAPAYTPAPTAISELLGLEDAYEYNPDKARELLAEAGYEDGFSVEAPTVPTVWQRLTLEGVQADLEKVGIDVEVQVMEPAAYSAMMNQGEAVMGNMNVGSQMADPDEVFYEFLHSSRTPGLNRAVFKNDEFDAIVEEARVTTDEEKWLELYREAAAIVVEEAPWAFIHYPYINRAIAENLHGVRQFPTRPDLCIKEAWFSE